MKRINVILALTVLFITGCAPEQTNAQPVALVKPTVSALLQLGSIASDRAASEDSKLASESSETASVEATGSETVMPENQQLIDAASDNVQNKVTPVSTVAAFFGQDSVDVLANTPTPSPPVSFSRDENNIKLGFGGESVKLEDLNKIIVYDDELNSSWSLKNSDQVEYNLQSTSRWFETLDRNLELDSGPLSIEFEPTADNGKLYFTVNQNPDVVYSRDKIMGVSFWLHSGQEILDNSDVRVTVVGSNERTYWSPDDYSVFLDSEDTFSQTELYFLNINRAIPQDTWVQVEIWLDELLFDPDYEYVTGIYVKTDAGFRNKIYIDNLALIARP